MISNSLGKLPSAIPDTQTYSKSEKEVYESVLQKYYQILQSFLLKMNEFYISTICFIKKMMRWKIHSPP